MYDGIRHLLVVLCTKIGALCLLYLPLCLQWRCLMCPLKPALTVAELKWSKRLESVRKYVECFFGRLKGRFRILKMPLMFWVSNANSREKIDNILFACCMVQSVLHAYNGFKCT
ncbi:unnamed protein product [Discosporangium mesarthrocarpum]